MSGSGSPDPPGADRALVLGGGGLTGIASLNRMQYRFTHLERMGDLEKTALLERRAINRSVMNVRDISEQTSSASEETAASSVELARLGVHLQGLVSKFVV